MQCFEHEHTFFIEQIRARIVLKDVPAKLHPLLKLAEPNWRYLLPDNNLKPENRIPSEMEVAPLYKLFILLTLFKQFTLLTLFILLAIWGYRAKIRSGCWVTEWIPLRQL